MVLACLNIISTQLQLTVCFKNMVYDFLFSPLVEIQCFCVLNKYSNCFLFFYKDLIIKCCLYFVLHIRLTTALCEWVVALRRYRERAGTHGNKIYKDCWDWPPEAVTLKVRADDIWLALPICGGRLWAVIVDNRALYSWWSVIKAFKGLKELPVLNHYRGP